MIDEVEEWKIQRTLELVREMGAATIVEFFPWAYLEPQEGVYAWEQADRIISHAQDQGIRVIARLGMVPRWAQMPTSSPPQDSTPATLNTLPIEAYPRFAAFAAAFAARYADRIDQYIIWNEPNLAFEWGYAAVDPARYLDLLRIVYPALHDADSSAVVLAGALAPTLEPPGSPHGLNDLIFLEQLYASGAADFFDALAVHTYGFTFPAQRPPDPDELNFRRVELLRAIMERYGDVNTPVFITETGWNDDPRWDKAVSPAERSAQTLAALQIAETWPWLETLCLWVFRTPTWLNTYQDRFALVTPNFDRSPVYEVIRAYSGGRSFDERLWLPAPR
ncbi:MAG: beta-galactosidase [Candidatus Flexifilum sp.]